MRQRLPIILTIVVILALLVILNTITYVKEQKVNDSELTANRSTYHAGPTGIRALYDFLSESGYQVMRWRESTDKLLSESGSSVKTFVVVGTTQLPFSEAESQSLLRWVGNGGQLVLIDRDPDPQLLPDSNKWGLSSRQFDFPPVDLDVSS